MASLKEVSTSQGASECLRRALQAESPRERARMAQRGLDAIEAALDPDDLDPDTHALLLRQLYLAYLESRRFQQAAEVALRMAAIGPLKDVAHHDACRAYQALGDVQSAIAQQRLATRASPPERRSFHYWSLATLLHFAGDERGAIGALERGERWAHVDRPLLRAHRAWIRLEAGQAVRGLDAIASDLEQARCREGYGQLVLGMLRHAMGDDRRAAVHLRAFLRRNAAADPAKAITLREELRRARLVLARIESD